MNATISGRPPSRARQPKTPQDPLHDPREVSTSEAPPQGWSTGLRVRRRR